MASVGIVTTPGGTNNASPDPNASTSAVPPEIESTLNRISAHRNVRGVMVLSREGPIIRSSGAVFDGEHGRKYAGVVKKIVDTCKAGLDEVVEGGDDLRFLRIRTRKYEIMISPDDHYLLVVVQDPSQ